MKPSELQQWGEEYAKQRAEAEAAGTLGQFRFTPNAQLRRGFGALRPPGAPMPSPLTATTRTPALASAAARLAAMTIPTRFRIWAIRPEGARAALEPVSSIDWWPMTLQEARQRFDQTVAALGAPPDEVRAYTLESMPSADAPGFVLFSEVVFGPTSS